MFRLCEFLGVVGCRAGWHVVACMSCLPCFVDKLLEHDSIDLDASVSTIVGVVGGASVLKQWLGSKQALCTALDLKTVQAKNCITPADRNDIVLTVNVETMGPEFRQFKSPGSSASQVV